MLRLPSLCLPPRMGALPRCLPRRRVPPLAPPYLPRRRAWGTLRPGTLAGGSGELRPGPVCEENEEEGDDDSQFANDML
jgi:hypothetical protein